MNTKFIILFSCILYCLVSCSPVKNAVRPADYVPSVEVQVNNTPKQIDDYVTPAGYIPCQARVLNPKTITNFITGAFTLNFPGGVPVQLRNILPPPGTAAHGGQLLFSSAGGGAAGSATLNITLPEDGTFQTFYVKGSTLSTVDKDAIIEVLENRTNPDNSSRLDNIILARKSMQVKSTLDALPGSDPNMQITINGTSTIDDYLTWSPMTCYLNIDRSVISGDYTVTIQNADGGDKLRFADNTSLTAHTNTATLSSITVTIPAAQSSLTFYAAGYFNAALPTSNSRGSAYDKDAVMEVRLGAGSGGTVLAKEGVMVRIRKNANGLTVEERDRFLRAFNSLNSIFGRYADFYNAHRRNPALGTAYRDFTEMHSFIASGGALGIAGWDNRNSSFLPWHRAFLLHIERDLQTIDPSVALPYWKFDAPAPAVFSTSFLGFATAPSNNAVLSATNPISGWAPPGGGALISRRPIYNQLTGIPAGVLSDVAVNATLPNGVYNTALLTAIETTSHGAAHLQSGTAGSADYINNFDASVKDPLFFLLHTNVDRVWAQWQRAYNQYDPNTITAYDKPGLFPTAAPFGADLISEYADETMWPWNGKIGPGSTGSTLDVRPTVAPIGILPETEGFRFSPLTQPQVKALIDYRSNRSFTSVNAGFNFCYDDSPY